MEKSPRVYLSVAGDSNKFSVIANVLMMAEALVGEETPIESIEDALVRRKINPTPENIAKVKSFFPADRVWQRESVPAKETELATVK